MAAHEVFVGAEEWRGVYVAVVPHQNGPALRLQNARELDARLGRMEPVEGLPGNNEVNARIGQGRGFGAAIHHGEAGIGREILLAGKAHLAIGFYADHAVAVVEKYLGEKSRPASNVGNEVLAPQAASILQSLHDIR